MAPRRFVSVITPVFNDRAGLRGCLEALADQTYPHDHMEIIVVDNGSADSVEDIIAEFEAVTLLWELRTGSYAARNRGIRAARGEVLAFIDSDCVAAPDWLGNGVKSLEAAGAGSIVGGRVRTTVRDPGKLSAAEIYDLVCAFPMRQYVEQSRFAGAGNLFVFDSAFRDVGPFNGDLKSGGDREWSLRAGARGYEVIYAHDVVVSHPARTRLGQLMRKKRRVVGGAVILDGKLAGYKPHGRGRSPSLPYVKTREFVKSRAEPKGLMPRLVVIWVLVLLSLVATGERVRLALGGKPIR